MGHTEFRRDLRGQKRVAYPSLSKRFWSEAAVEHDVGGYGVTLDAHKLRTPAKSALIVPTRALAEAIADEWCGVKNVVNPATMPLTRRANAAIDKVAAQYDDVVNMLADYGASDLLCYRATDPTGLIKAQAGAWDPLLAWAENALGAPLIVTSGISPIAQDRRALEKLKQHLSTYAPFALTGLHDLVTLSGSLIIGLAAAHEHKSIGDLWDASQVDEAWQTHAWGEDDEARAWTEQKRSDFFDAYRFYLMAF